MENLSVVDQMRHDVDGDGEDDGAVVLGRDAVQGLKVAQLRIIMSSSTSYRVSQKKWCIAISNSRVVLDDQSVKI